MQSPPSVCSSVYFPFYLRNRLTVDLERLRVRGVGVTIARRRLKVKVMGQANAVGPTSINGSFFLVYSATNIMTADFVNSEYVATNCIICYAPIIGIRPV